MSVCFFLPSQGSQESAEGEPASPEPTEATAAECTDIALQQFWEKINDDVQSVTQDDFKTQTLPLARIKKIMKLDEDVKMISAEAPVLFAKACEIFIHELTLRAWVHTEDNKRRTLQRNDIAMAISKSDQFDFLIDIVPRHEVKSVPRREEPSRGVSSTDQYYLQLAQQHQAALQTPQQQQQQQHQPQQQQIILQPQIVQNSAAGSSGVSQQPVTILQQLLQPNSEIQQIQLTPAQLNMLRMQINNSSQPIIIQQQGQPQIIQVQSSQPQQTQQVFITQAATTQGD